MIDAFDINVLGFVPKRMINDVLESKIQFVESKIRAMNQIILSTIEGEMLFKENEILMFYIEDGCIFVLLNNKKKYRLVYDTLKETGQRLTNCFVRVTSSCIVNFSEINRIDIKNHCIFLTNNEMIKVSRRKWIEIKKRYIESKMNI